MSSNPLIPRALANYAETLKRLVKMTEDFFSNVYFDGKGVPTVGYGFALATTDGKTWSVNTENTLLPTVLSKTQAGELDKAIANLNKYGLSTKAKTENEKISSNLKLYSVTEPQANSMLEANIKAAEAVVERVLKKNGLTNQAWLGLAGSRELAALVDMKFNGLTFTLAAQALVKGDRATLWYEIRYGNKSATGSGENDRGLQKRRYWDAEWVGLYEKSNATEKEAKDAYLMLTKNREIIFESETLHGLTPDGRRGSLVVSGKTAFELAQDPTSAGP
jgi:GH24 family phage-related lysozyme (muramidase)